MNSKVWLITYADRLAGDLKGLKAMLADELDGLFGGVHVLPFFEPIDGADAGFDPVDHTAVDARLGGWADVRSLAENHSIMADVIVNHVSADSPQFSEVKQQQENTRWWDLFLKKTDVFPAEADGSASEIQEICRPRPGQPFTAITLGDGRAVEFWTTFSDQQLDINVESTEGKAYLESILGTFADAGIRELRLDAAGYAIKRRGTTCFMLPETFDFIAALSSRALSFGMQSLVEIHAHYRTQIEIASRVGRVYDFALPPLVLHTLFSGDATALKSWLEIAPRNCVTVLDTHDGIGILDVAEDGSRPGLLPDKDIECLVETIHRNTRDESRKASGHAASNLDIYQVNTTYYDALGRSDRDYLLARAIQLFSPGTPQIYYVGLLAGGNDMELMARTGVGRDVNRHHFTTGEVRAAVQRPVVRSLFALIRLRNTLQVFGGVFSLPECGPNKLRMRWDNGVASAELEVALDEKSGMIVTSKDGEKKTYTLGKEFREVQ